MENIMTFNNPEFGAIRTVEIGGEPWFVGKDVCAVFGDKNHNRSLGRVDAEDKRTVPMTDSMGRTQQIIIINESGLYALLFAMQPQKANNGGVSDAYPIEIQERIDKLRKFKRWVTSEVLPSIRRHGAYMTPDTLDKMISSPEFGIKLLTALKDEREKSKALAAENAVLTTENAAQRQAIADFQPIKQYVDTILSSTRSLTTTQIAADYDMSARKLNKILHEEGIQRHVNGQWILYQKYMGKGYTKSKTINITRSDGRPDTVLNTEWSQKGRLLIHEILTARGIQAIMDQQQIA